MERKIKIGTLALAAVFLAAISLLTVRALLHSGGSYSVYENRYLSVPGPVTAENLQDGSYFRSLEGAFSDHIAAREYWLKGYTALQKDVLKKPVVQGVVVQEELLLPKYTVTEPEDNRAAAVQMAEDLLVLQQTVEDYGGTFLFTGLPEQSSILGDRYPENAVDNQENYVNRNQEFFRASAEIGLHTLDMTPQFLESKDPTRLYCTGDHHYRLQGAYLTYTAICEALAEQGIEVPVLQETEFVWKALPNPYLGSLNRKLMGMWESTEPLWIYEPAEPIAFQRWDNGEPVEPTVFDLPDHDAVWVQYTVYMGGDKAETVIRTNRPELPDCLIFGDSFTNALETFLYTGFDETRSLDLRHYTQMGILEYVQTHQPDVVLCLQNDTVYLLPEGNGVIR